MGKGGEYNFRLSDCVGYSKNSEFFIYLLWKTDASAGNGLSHRDNLYFSIIALPVPVAYYLFEKPLKPCYIKSLDLDVSGLKSDRLFILPNVQQNWIPRLE
jgi:hypothetical protein